MGEGLEGEGMSCRSCRMELEGLTGEQLPPSSFALLHISARTRLLQATSGLGFRGFGLTSPRSSGTGKALGAPEQV